MRPALAFYTLDKLERKEQEKKSKIPRLVRTPKKASESLVRALHVSSFTRRVRLSRAFFLLDVGFAYGQHFPPTRISSLKYKGGCLRPSGGGIFLPDITKLIL